MFSARPARSSLGLAASLYWKEATSKRGAVRFTDGGIDPYHCEQYFDKHGKLDPTATGLFFATIEEPMATADIVPYDEFVATHFYREWAQPLGLIDCVNVVLEKSIASVAAFIVFRHLRDGMVDDVTRRRTRLHVPHIRRAVLIGRADLRIRSPDKICGLFKKDDRLSDRVGRRRAPSAILAIRAGTFCAARRYAAEGGLCMLRDFGLK
jgi:hypothetical protein